MLGYYTSIVVLIPAMILTVIAQAKTRKAFDHYSHVRNSKGITGAQAAQTVLSSNGLNNVAVKMLNGSALDNYYDPRDNTVNLSPEVYSDDSVASMCIACHEVGHAIQHANGYLPVKIRNAIVPIVTLTSNIAWPLIIIGLMLSYTNAYGTLLFNIGTWCFVAVVLFHLITLPVETNASRRAIKQMQLADIVDSRDLSGSKKVLKAAAMTYVAALAVAVSSLIRVLLLRGRN